MGGGEEGEEGEEGGEGEEEEGQWWWGEQTGFCLVFFLRGQVESREICR